MSVRDQELRKWCVEKVFGQAEYSTSAAELVARARTLEEFIKSGEAPQIIVPSQPHNVFDTTEKDTETEKGTDEPLRRDQRVREGFRPYPYQDKIRPYPHNRDNMDWLRYLNKDADDVEERVEALFEFIEEELGVQLVPMHRTWLEFIVRGRT